MNNPPKKSLGQHFLTNAGVAERLATAIPVLPDEPVLEIGSGTGKLTEKLLAHGYSVIAVEADRTLFANLADSYADAVAAGTLIPVHGDIRTLTRPDLGLVDGRFAVIANIPYYLTGTLLRTLLEEPPRPRNCAFLVQREIAERIAREEKGSVLSISVRAFGEPHYVMTVKPGSFSPPPAVESAILTITDISAERFGAVSIPAFFDLVRAGFSQKRKQLAGNLAPAYGTREEIHAQLRALGHAETARAEDLSVGNWLALARALLATDSNRGI